MAIVPAPGVSLSVRSVAGATVIVADRLGERVEVGAIVEMDETTTFIANPDCPVSFLDTLDRAQALARSRVS